MGNGTGGVSIYGEKFEDEQIWYPHTHKGVLSMANAGPNTNGSQFFICFGPTPHLNEKHTIFGRVIDNYAMVEKIENNKKMIVKIKEEEEKEKIYKIYLDAYGKNGVSKIIMKTMMPLINSELQRLMEDSCYFKLEIRINDKNEVEFIQVDNETQIEKLISSGSGYERTISSLALRAVLSKVCSLPKPNVIVFDEVFGKISNENLEMVYEFFVKIKSYFDKILIITHNPMLSQWSDGVIKIEKENNVSKVIQ